MKKLCGHRKVIISEVFFLMFLLKISCGYSHDLSPVPVAVINMDQSASVGHVPVGLCGIDSFVKGVPDTRPDTALWTVVQSPSLPDGSPGASIRYPENLRTLMDVDVPGLIVVRLDLSYQGREGIPGYMNIFVRGKMAQTAGYLDLSYEPALPVAGNPVTITAFLTDFPGNPMENKNISFSVDSGQGSLDFSQTDLTGEDGKTAITYQTHTAVETARITASLDDDPSIFSSISIKSVPGPATGLFFSVEPSSSLTGEIISPPVEVRTVDDNLNTAINSTAPITIQLIDNPFDASLSGVRSVVPANGIATFIDLSIDLAGTGYKLKAESLGLEDATSLPFSIYDSTAYELSVKAEAERDTYFPWDTISLSAKALGGNPPYSFSWRLTRQSVNQAVTFLADSKDDWPGSESAEVKSPLLWIDRAGEYEVTVLVTDSIGIRQPATVNLEILSFSAIPEPEPISSDEDATSYVRMAVNPETGSLAAASKGGATIWSTKKDSHFGTMIPNYISCTSGRTGTDINLFGLEDARFAISFKDSHMLTLVDDYLEPGGLCSHIFVGEPLVNKEPEIYSLARRENGDLWIATESDITYLPSGEENVSDRYELEHNGVDTPYLAIAFGHSFCDDTCFFENLFISDNNARYFHSLFPFDRYSPPINEFQNNITGLMRGLLDPYSSTNEMWLAVEGGGVHRIENVLDSSLITSSFLQSDGLSSNFVEQMSLESLSGDVWIATDDGLSRYKRDINRVVSLPIGTSGLCNTRIFAVASDGYSQERGRRIYIGCEGSAHVIIDKSYNGW